MWHRGHKGSKAPCPPSNLTTNLPSSYTPSLQLLQYCWGNCAITLRNKLQKLQNRAARVLTFADYDEDAGHLFEVLGWKNLVRQHEIVKATMVLSLYASWLQNIYVLGLEYKKRQLTLETLRINFASPYHG